VHFGPKMGFLPPPQGKPITAIFPAAAIPSADKFRRDLSGSPLAPPRYLRAPIGSRPIGPAPTASPEKTAIRPRSTDPPHRT